MEHVASQGLDEAAHRQDDDCSNYSCGSWYNVPTPPPSPPHSPPPQEDDPKQSDEEGGFQNINVDDYHEYEQWYAEDHLGEDVEMHKYLVSSIAKTLTDEEVDSIIMLAIHQFGTVTQ
ncbi:hypothetical protein FRC11_004795, partial [Ceratobasidium sp. 423]